jgi:hypothetical protein
VAVPAAWNHALDGGRAPGQWLDGGPSLGSKLRARIVPPSGSARLLALDRALNGVWQRLQPGRKLANAALLRAALAGPGATDPLLRGALWSQLLSELGDIGQVSAEDVRAVIAEALPSSEPYRQAAFRIGRAHPDLAWDLMAQAERSDPAAVFSPELQAPLWGLLHPGQPFVPPARRL